jgi:PRC-barrel domain
MGVNGSARPPNLARAPVHETVQRLLMVLKLKDLLPPAAPARAKPAPVPLTAMRQARPSRPGKSRNEDVLRGVVRSARTSKRNGTRCRGTWNEWFERTKEAFMLKKLMLGTAIGALIATGALAQTPNAAAKSDAKSPPAATAQSAPSSAQPNGKADFVLSQKPDQWLASKFKGTDVLGADNKSIGDVSDILFDKNGKIEAYVVSIGGFLGMGAKEVALAPSSFEVVPGKNGKADVLKLSITEKEVKQAQNFTAYKPPHPATTTGMGGAMPHGMAPTGAPPIGH